MVSGGYDEAARCAAEEAQREKRLIIADTGYPGYMEIPLYLQQGYMTLFQEISLQLKEQGNFIKKELHIRGGTGILLINTEADTDPDGYHRIIGKTSVNQSKSSAS